MLQPDSSRLFPLFLSCYFRRPGDAAGSDSKGVSSFQIILDQAIIKLRYLPYWQNLSC